MKFQESVLALLREYSEKEHGGDVKATAKTLGVEHVTLWHWLRGTRSPNLSQLSRAMDTLGIGVSSPRRSDTTREICFINPHVVPAGESALLPDSEDYLAVPLVGEAGAGPGIIPQNRIESWVLVYRNHRSVMRRTNLLAVEVGKNQRSMTPTLHPGDIVLVDRNDWGQEGFHAPGNIFLVREPGQEGGGKVKRIALSGKGKAAIITFYSDNVTENEPEPYPMHAYDYDLRAAVVGRVVWAWADLSRK